MPTGAAVKGAFRFNLTHLLAGMLIAWMLVTHPQAAWAGKDRNWFLTYLQLWFLLWLAGVLMDSPAKYRQLMWVFALTTLVSAVSVINRQGGFTSEIDPLVRASGLTQGANTAARYFTVTFVFLFYLRTVSRNFFIRLGATLGMIVTFLGVFYTVSRTGMLLLAIALAMLFLLQSKFKYRLQITVISGAALLVLFVFSGSIFAFIGEIAPSIEAGSDTVGLRYALWDAGVQMWQDHPVSGVGIGEFKFELKNYPNRQYAFLFNKGLVAHNMYISMLAETGAMGFLLFIALLGKCLLDLWKAGRIKDPQFKALRNVWLIVLVVMVLGGLTKTDQVDKLLWLTMGVSVFFNNLAKMERRKAVEKPKEYPTPQALMEIKTP